MKPFSGSDDEPSSILRSFFRCISGSSLLRSRNTAVYLMRSMRCSVLARARTSSTTDNCGIAKRSPAASTISAETMARVSGILMVTELPSPATLLMSMVPPIWSILVRTTSMPTPRPETEVMAAAVGEPGGKEKLRGWVVCALAAGRPGVGGAWVGGGKGILGGCLAHSVGERVLDQIEHLAVEL